ncbi:MAG: hypothetical protein KDB73_04690 [Planctomycetes bacterium]|nr:hypothetical protein [Planctomycetota bacterium]
MRERRAVRRLAPLPTLLLTLLLPSAAAVALDEVTFTNGRTVRGHVTSNATTVRVNTFGCTVADMTLGVETFPRADVRSIDPWPLDDALVAGLDEIAEIDVARREALLQRAIDGRVKDFVERLGLELLARSPSHPAASKALGRRAPAAEALAADLRVAPALRTGLRLALRRRDAASRREEVLQLAARTGWTPDGLFVERCARLLVARRGVLEDLVATWPEDEEDRGTYSLYVPERLDPIDPRPLVVALHGGGTDPQNPKAVRGRGKELLPVLVDEARQRGFLVLCPTALEWPWTTTRNQRWVQTLVDEVASRWHVDLERVHLVGLGEGGTGAWTLGTKDADAFASVGAASAPRAPGHSALLSKGVRLWCFHGERDDVVPVDDVRAQAETWRKKKADAVYCELPREGHGWPPAAVRDWGEAVASRRRPRASSAFPRSSFLVPLGETERARSGDPAAAWHPESFEGLGADALWAHIMAGRAEAEPAAHAFLVYGEGPGGAAWREQARALVGQREAPVEAVRVALGLLEQWKDPEALVAVGDVLRTRDEPRLVEAAAGALGALGEVQATQDLRFALRTLHRGWKGQGTTAVPFGAFEAAAGAARALVEAAGRTRADKELLAEIEEIVALGILKDPRGVAADPTVGEDVTPIRLGLLDALARTYRSAGGSKTLTDMLFHIAGRDGPARLAVTRGAAEGW